MATNINTILSWFKTGLKPTQAQFWASWTSFWHKDEMIPQSSINNLTTVLNAKTENVQFDAHMNDPNAHAESIGGKLDRDGYAGTAKIIDERLSAIENPDRVLKFGTITLTGLNVTIAANAFAWVLNRISFLTPGAYAKTITAATTGMYRTDIVAGNDAGGYEIIKGVEAATGEAAAEPPVPNGKIKLGFISVFGATVAGSGSAPAIEKPIIVDADRIVIDDSVDSFSKKSVKFLNVKTALKAYFDNIYQSFMGIVTVAGTTYQLLLTDNGKKIMCTSATAVALVIPTNAIVALPIGAKIKVTQQGDGVITLTTTGLTIISSSPLYTVKGQTIILEKTAINSWTIEGNNLAGEIRLAAYPNTRNDGQIPINKVLSPDADGNLKLYTIATAPAPYLDELIPDSYAPSNTGDFILRGAFFTPSMTVAVTGQTVNRVDFISDNEVRANVTTGAAEGTFDVILNNGLNAIFAKRMLIVLGTVFKPTSADWINVTGSIDKSSDGEVHSTLYNASGSAKWNRLIDKTKNWSVRFNLALSPLGVFSAATGTDTFFLSLVNTTTAAEDFKLSIRADGFPTIRFKYFGPTTTNYVSASASGANYNEQLTYLGNQLVEFRKIGTALHIYYNNVITYTFPESITNDYNLLVRTKSWDVINIKYIELA